MVKNAQSLSVDIILKDFTVPPEQILWYVTGTWCSKFYMQWNKYPYIFFKVQIAQLFFKASHINLFIPGLVWSLLVSQDAEGPMTGKIFYCRVSGNNKLVWLTSNKQNGRAICTLKGYGIYFFYNKKQL